MQTVDPFSVLRWYQHPTFWIAVAAAVTALATIAYVWISKRLWESTKENALAARVSAEAAQQSAKIVQIQFEAAYRPYLAVSGTHIKFIHTEQVSLRLTCKNYGDVPCELIKFETQLSAGIIERAERTGNVVLPREEMHIDFGVY